LEISFIPSSKEISLFASQPKPAKNYLPDWYKKSERFDKENISFAQDGSIINSVLKQCVPFLDSMTSGYIQELWTDLYIEKIDENKFSYYYSSGPDPMGIRDCLRIPAPNNFYQQEMFWRIPWIPKTPKNYSLLFVHPLNRTDLPFLTTSGIQDSDMFYHVPFGNYPFLLDKNFSGIIPKGTPMYQIIPIRRDSWNSKIKKFDEDEMIKRYKKFRINFWGTYRKMFWVKKTYN